MIFDQTSILELNCDNDINPRNSHYGMVNEFSHNAIKFIIKDDLDGFVELASREKFNKDGSYSCTLERFYLSDYLYQKFFDKLTKPNILCVAAFFKAEKIVDFLLQIPDVDTRDSFHFACAGGSLEIVRKLFNVDNCNQINKDGYRPMSIAAYFGHLDVVKHLYAHGCEIISQNDDYSSINKAAFNGNINVLDFFRNVDEKAFKNENFRNPIISAAKGGQPNCIKYLLDVCKVSKSSIVSALNEVCKNGSLSCVKILVDAYVNSTSNKKQKNQDNQNKTQKKITLPKSAYINSIEGFQVDVLKYLFTIFIPKLTEDYLIMALNQNHLSPYRDDYINIISETEINEREKEEAKFIRGWKQKSFFSIQMAKLIYKNSDSNILNDRFFQKALENDIYENTILFLKEIKFMINKDQNLSEIYIQFFRSAILNATPITIKALCYILSNSTFDLFLYDNFVQCFNDKSVRHEKDDTEKNYEKILADTFISFAELINLKKFSYKQFFIYTILLNNCCFPFFMFARLNYKSSNEIVISHFRMQFFYNRFDDVNIFNCHYYQNLVALFIEAKHKFCKNKGVSILPVPYKLVKVKDFLKYFYNLNSQKLKEQQCKFNLFTYKCSDEKEKGIYDKIMDIVKLFIKRVSHNSHFAIFLCKNGLNKEWIIDQMNQNQGEEINEDKSQSINPLINILNFNMKKLIDQRLLYETFKYYMINGIDISPNSCYTGIIWKIVIEKKKGDFARLLIDFGNAEKDFLLTKNDLGDDFMFNAIDLFSYALFNKAVNVIYVFLEKEFYHRESPINIDPEKLINELNEDTNHREENLKIIALIYKFKDISINNDIREKLIKELKEFILTDNL